MEGPTIRPDNLKTVPRFRVTAQILIHAENPDEVLSVSTLEDTFDWKRMTATQHVAAIRKLLEGAAGRMAIVMHECTVH